MTSEASTRPHQAQRGAGDLPARLRSKSQVSRGLGCKQPICPPSLQEKTAKIPGSCHELFLQGFLQLQNVPDVFRSCWKFPKIRGPNKHPNTSSLLGSCSKLGHPQSDRNSHAGKLPAPLFTVAPGFNSRPISRIAWLNEARALSRKEAKTPRGSTQKPYVAMAFET